MGITKKMGDRKYVFGSLFIISNRVDTLLQREFNRFGITTKQWFLSIILDNLFEKPPTMNEVANEMGSSHQNVKQVALKLEEKGLLILEKDKKDARITRLKLSESSVEFWEMIKQEGAAFTEALFKDINEEELATVRGVMQKMQLNINEMEHENE